MKTTNISVALELVRKMATEDKIEFALVHKNGIYEIVEIQAHPDPDAPLEKWHDRV
jgi:hypothetical protein